MNEEIVICPACEAENTATSPSCEKCGQSLIVVCPRCNTVNDIRAAQCFACAQRFDMLGQIMARHEIRFEDRFTRRADAVVGVKAEEQVQATSRSEELWKVEQERRAKLAAQKRRQQEQERTMIIFAAVAVGGVVILFVLALAGR